MNIKQTPGRDRLGPLVRRPWLQPCALAALLGIFLGSGNTYGADPVVPSVPTDSTLPAAPAPAPEAPVIPGFAPGEGLPSTPFTPGEFPQMELIPNGMTPLLPNSLSSDQGLGQAQPLVPQAPQPVDLKSLKYRVSKFNIKYGLPKQATNPRLPPAQSLADAPVMLGEAPPAAPVPGTPAPTKKAPMKTAPAVEPSGGLVGPGTGLRDVPVVPAQVKVPETFSGDALQAIYTSLVGQLNKKGIYGVFVTVDPDQINPSTGEDLRKGGTELTMLIYASEVRQVRTIVKPVAKPPFKAPSTSLDDPKYRKISVHSPLQGPTKDQPGSLLRQAALQNYVDRINRFPGRRVDVAVTASGENAGVILDYIVHVERPPVYLFSQFSNTGTEASGTWRSREGVEVRQLLGWDDILDASVETSFSLDTYSVYGSYQVTPIFPDYLKLKAYGGYGRFLAEDVGFDEARFVGRSATAGLLAIYTPYYFKGFPLDLIAGVEYKYVDIADVGTFPQEGRTNFLLPIVGVSTDRTTELFNVFASAQVEPNLPGLIGTDNDELQKMGRFNVDRDFVIAKYSLGGSFFLEPLLFRGSWNAYQEEADPAKRQAFWPKLTEAHEIALLLHGQYTFADKRLIPQFEDVIGGFASVRGYPEAFTSGDDTIIGNIEYKFHLLRVLKPADIGTPADAAAKPAPTGLARFTHVSLRPPTILGRPDIDVILRTFYDVGYAKNNNLVPSTEADRLLMSVGVGAEVQVSRYLNLRLDCGFPLISVTDKTSRPVDVGSPRLSFIAVLSF